MAVMAGRAAAPDEPQARRPRARVRRRSPLLDRLTYAALRAATGVLGLLPMPVALRLGEAGAWVVYALDRPRRRVGMRNLEIAFPDRPLGERRRILRASFLNLGRTAVELARLPRLRSEDVRAMVRFEDEAHWAEVMGRSHETGLLVLSGHFGNWELLVYANGVRGFPVSLVHRTIANPRVDRWLNAVRARAGTRLIRKSHAAVGVLRALRDHEILVMPFDQNSTRSLGVFVDFFGLPASTNSGLARLALRTGAPILPAFIVREGSTARHRVRLLPLVHTRRTDDPETDVQRTTQQLSDLFERMVREHPEQWLWAHKRWKTRPLGQPKLY